MGELTDHADRFLDYNNYSEAAYKKVGQTLAKFEFMVDLASRRAIDELPIPAECVVIQFPTRTAPPIDVA